MRPLLFAVLLAAAAPHTIAAQATQGPGEDVEALRALVIRSGEAFNARDPDGIMALYSRDIVLSYPGIPDTEYEAIASGYREMTNLPAGVTVNTVPDIEEIIVSGDMGIVRVTWNTTTVRTEPAQRSTRQMRDLQVWRREADGWKFYRGMHFRVPHQTPPSGG